MICRGGILAALRAMHGIAPSVSCACNAPHAFGRVQPAATSFGACIAPHAFGRVHRTPRQEQVYLDLENEIQLDGA